MGTLVVLKRRTSTNKVIMKRTAVVSLVCAFVHNVDAFVPLPFTLKTNTIRETGILAATLEGRKIEGVVNPVNNFVLVKKAKAIDETAGGIILTGTAKIEKTEGVVVSAGPGKTHQESGVTITMPVVKGEKVVYGQYDGTELEYNGEMHTLIRDDDILLKYSGDELTIDGADVIRDNVLVFVETKEEETAGGLLIAASATKGNKPSTGKVVKVGPGRMASNGALMAMDVAIGDMVKFRDFAGNEVKMGDKEYAVVRFTDLLAKF